MAAITDGLSNTYLLGEKFLDPDNYFSGNDPGDNENAFTGLNWDLTRSATDPNGGGYADIPPAQDSPASDVNNIQWGFGSAHPGQCSMTFCDGSIHSISYGIDPETHRRLCNRADGLPVDPTKY